MIRNDRAVKGEPSNLSSSIVATLKEQIIHWQYPPEHRLTEAELCEKFNVSRSPVREALRVLASDGFVKKLPNRAYVVRQYNLSEIEELYDFRLALELYTVERLATKDPLHRNDKEAISKLKSTWIELLNGPAKKADELAKLDTLFHETLAHALGNRPLLQHLRTINERLMLFRMIDFDKSDRAESTCRQHLKILKCITAGDAPGARAAMQRNIEEGRNNVHTAIKDALAKAYSSRA
ncbi:MAG TPA: GntR family transcriptional regulator [Nitrospira sp.]|nr:GntR family transcriptional regulator [Nitrospira sp.]